MNTTVKPINHISVGYGMFIPLALMIASVISGCLSFSRAKQNIADELNGTMIALANENRELWTRQDTIAALHQMQDATHKPIIYQASDLKFRNIKLKDKVYYTLALVDDKNTVHKIEGDRIVSDSIILVPAKTINGFAVQVQGFADCSMATVFAVSDQTVPGILLSLSILYMAFMIIRRRMGRDQLLPEAIPQSPRIPSLDGIKLTPMQRQLTQLLLDAPDKKVDKATLCEALWDNKSNAEESLYTLVRRTKKALAQAGIEIICNRGDSYELHVNS